MTKHTFKVKKTKASESVQFTVKMPTTLADEELILARFGSVERMIDRANSQWTVDVAVGIRKRLPNVENATAYAKAYCDDGRKDSYTPKIDAEAAVAEVGFSEEQLEYLRQRNLVA